ncbi:NAD(P)H-dependent oxidoreductase [Mycolicibacterium goodii]|uniref:NAD(P)H-dependent oxidoreductase n=1 Tax=Mycolicibacterium goodii TaxID=134601 RepID=UPI001BDD76A1|nr:NAD(P)H-dependent oxidoreductase [Mycolicibacterium goodii]MBU8812888.1 NAD(P)H-dependent oxidoreductase [Mycolicibacterium goodii]MBU8829137.1 NAD(P)H-dependent oxidoreductase [Mycolicibacterium goodii]
MTAAPLKRPHPPQPGTALWLYAHPLRGSLNDHLFRSGTEALSEQYTVLTSDLHAQRFDPVLGDRDFAGRSGNIVEITGEAYHRGELPDDVRAEQDKLAAAELLVVQFPLWWYGPPAILKGWFDRVLTNGFAYGELDPELGVPRRYGDGHLVGRRALIVVTVGEDARSLGSRGISGDVDSLLFPLTHGTLWYTGVGSFDLHVIYDADGLGPEGVQRETERLCDRLKALDTESAGRFRRLADGDYHGTRALREDIHPGRTDLGIHLSERVG